MNLSFVLYYPNNIFPSIYQSKQLAFDNFIKKKNGEFPSSIIEIIKDSLTDEIIKQTILISKRK